ncbi:MAG TPA: TIGR04255 family protein [Terriglobia bacterium]|nr:TIGR04255 family protein [Terriglobia bacterium]
MAEVFPKAPITEALIDIRVELPEDATLPKLEELHDLIRAAYPGKKPRRRFEAQIEFKEEQQPLRSSTFQQDGYYFTSADGKRIVQYRLDGFSFNRLRPYSRWEDLRDEARKAWRIYAMHANPLAVNRLAVRYINSIEIPFKSFDFDDYFTAIPKIPEGLPQVLQHFFTRTMIPFFEQGVTAVIIQTPSGKQDPLSTAIILDIDVFMEKNLEPEDKLIWEIFEELRYIKNEIFFKSIKDRTKELFR